MKKYEHQPISSLLLGRAHLYEIVITAIFMGFGISLIVSSITLFNKFEAFWGLCTGLIISVVSLIFIGIRILGRRNGDYVFNGFFILNEKQNKIISIDTYKFANNLSCYLIDAFAENKVLEHIWNSEPLRLQDEQNESKNRSINIIREAIEYYLLDSLFSHLISFFGYPAEHKKNISVYERDNIPSTLLKNRFLDLFSKPMCDRENFIGIEETIEEDSVPFILEANGAVYRKFLLVLPYKSIVQKKDNEIIIKTRRFTLNMNVLFDGCNTSLPEGFLEHFLSIEGFYNFLSNVIYSVNIKISVKFKLSSIFSPYGWEDYNWIDSFLDRLNNDISKDEFFKRINWNTVYTIIKCMR